MISMPMASTHLTPDLHSYQGSSTSTLHSRSGRRLSQTASSTSSNFQSLPHLPWENSLLQSAEVGERSELTHIHSMQFSADSTILTVLTQPPKANKLTWYCWDATSTGGTRIRIGKYNRDLEVCDSISDQIEASKLIISKGQSGCLPIMDDCIHSVDARTICDVCHTAKYHPTASVCQCK